jgi:hypothetical protein
MKRLILFLMLPCIAMAQAYRVDPIPVMTTSGTAPVGGFPVLYAVAGAAIKLYTNTGGTVLASTYTDATGLTSCPTSAQVLPAGKSGVGACTPYTDNQGNFGFWLAAGTYYYTITLPAQAGGAIYGPYPVTAPANSPFQTLSTNGTTGAASLVSGNLNIPAYTGVVANGSIAMATSSITPGACQPVTPGSVNSATATGVLTSDVVDWTPNGSIKAVTGFIPGTSGGLSVVAYPTAGYVNFDVCNWSSSTITPGSITINYSVRR